MKRQRVTLYLGKQVYVFISVSIGPFRYRFRFWGGGFQCSLYYYAIKILNPVLSVLLAIKLKHLYVPSVLRAIKIFFCAVCVIVCNFRASNISVRRQKESKEDHIF